MCGDTTRKVTFNEYVLINLIPYEDRTNFIPMETYRFQKRCLEVERELKAVMNKEHRLYVYEQRFQEKTLKQCFDY